MQQHHRDAIERWAEAAADDDEVLAVVVAGSLTKGYGLADSDVDGEAGTALSRLPPSEDRPQHGRAQGEA